MVPHCAHTSAGAKPRRLINTSACSPRFTVSSIARIRLAVRPSVARSTLRSIKSTRGNAASGVARSVSANDVKRPRATLLRVSSDGVAEPSTTGQLAAWARNTATSRAEYRNPSCCLNEGSCSSSTTIKPSRGIGVNTASLVPITIFARPAWASR